MIVRLASVQPGTLDAEKRTVDIVWTTGATVRRRLYDWANDRVVDIDEVLSVKPTAVRMERLTSGRAPLLNAHSSWRLGDVMGVIESASIANGEGRARVRFAKAEDDEDADRVFRKVADGILPNISVGYDVHRWNITREEGKPERWEAVDWEPMEISLVPIGADMGAAVRGEDGSLSRSKPDHIVPCEFIYNRAKPATEQKGETPMPAQKKRAAGAAPDPVRNDEEEDVRENEAETEREEEEEERAEGEEEEEEEEERSAGAVETERKRVLDIRKAGRAFALDDVFVDRHIERGSSIDQVRSAAQAILAKRSTATRQRPYIQTGGQDEVETRRALVANAIEHRVRPSVKLDQGARQFRGMSMLELAKDVLTAEGVSTRGLARMEVASIALGCTRAPGMLSTSDFPLILANVANKRLREIYDMQTSRWREFCRQSNASDFKPKSVVALSEAPRLEKVYEGGEYKYGKLTEDGTTYALSTYGKIIPITRQSIINDDLSAFDRMPTLFGRAASDLEADIVWALITSNPTMSDGVTLFHAASHGNLTTGPGTAISITSLGVARALMRKQKNIGGLEFLNIQAKFLVVPPDLETLADQHVTQITPALASSVNPFIGRLTPLVEARLSAASTTAWYLIADPNQIDTIEYAYLEGQEGVYTEQRMGFEVDGLELKVRNDFAAKAIDWRGFYKNDGA